MKSVKQLSAEMSQLKSTIAAQKAAVAVTKKLIKAQKAAEKLPFGRTKTGRTYLTGLIVVRQWIDNKIEKARPPLTEEEAKAREDLGAMLKDQAAKLIEEQAKKLASEQGDKPITN